ncbi:MAG: hypothetical protein JSR44_08425 [Spirochaetes bacterium]|nr:hypothetical protein [Spirochaetota bacterium]
MKKTLISSVSLPETSALLWRSKKREILRFGERYLRIQMRNQLRREVTRTYNRKPDEKFVITTTRFTTAEYDTFHYIAAALRVSVSFLIYGLIKLWQKPSRRAMRRYFCSNYSATTTKWDPEAGFAEESLIFWSGNTPVFSLPLLI